MTFEEIEQEFEDHDGQNGRDAAAGIEATKKWMREQRPPIDPNDKEVPVPRDAVNYGHCVSFGLSGCDIKDPDATYETMDDEGISGGYTDEPGYEDFRGDQPTTHANIGGSAWFDRCPASRCGDGYTPPVSDLTNYYNPEPNYHNPVNNDPNYHNPVNNDPICDNGFTVVSAHVDRANSDDGCRPPACDFGRGADGWCLPPANTDPPVIYIDGEDVDEDGGTASFRVVLSHASSQTVSVSVATSDGTATAGDDYRSVSRRVTFRRGYTIASVSVQIIDDATRGEPDETFTLTASNPSSNAELSATPQADATIIDNDIPLPSAVRNLTMNCSTVGVDGEVTVTWILPDEGDPYGYYGSITGPDSYRRVIYTLPAGSIEHTFDEAPGWGDYTATVYGYLLDGDGPTTTATQTCQPSSPMVALSDTTLTVGEGSSVQITATLDKAPNGTAAVSFTTSGAVRGSVSCFDGADFIVNNTSFTYTNTISASITLTACDDTDTDDETVTLVLTTTGISGLQLGSPTTVVVAITDDDSSACAPGWHPDPNNPGQCLPPPIFH